MADTVIKSFMVALGFKFDEAGLKKFEAQIKEVEKSVKHFAVGFAALAVGVEEAIRRVGREFEQLFFLSAQIGTSATHLASMQFAFSQIGVSVNEFNAAITSINELMMDSPGMRQFIASHVPSFIAETGTAEQAVIAMAEELEKLYAMPEGADKQNKITTERAFQRTMHLSNATMHQMALHGPERRKWQKEYDEWIEKLHFNEKEAAAASHRAMGALTFAWKQVSTGFSQLVTATMPAVTVVMKSFSEWLMEKGRDPKYKAWIDSITNWFEGPEKEKNIAKFKRALDQVLDAVLAVGRAAKMLVCWILELNSAIGTTGTLLTVLFGFLFLKGAIIGIGQGLAALLFAPLIAGATAAGSAIGTALGVAVRRAFLPLAALLIGWELGRMLSDAIDKHFPAGKKALDTTAQAGADFFNWITGGNKVTGLSPYAKRRAQDLPPELRPPADRPGTYDGPPMGASGGHDTLLEQMVMGLQHWWAGSGNFRPYVVLTESTYTSLADMLRDVFGLVKPRDSKGVPGDAGTAAAGPGGAGPHGMPGPGGGGGGGGSDTAGIAFPEGWVPDPNAPQMATGKQEFTHPERNNPGNLRAGGGGAEGWVGQTTPPGSAFETFKTVEEGIRARAITYFSYITKRGADTIQKIAERSGPASDNNDIPSQVAAYRKALGGKYAEKGGENLPIEATPENLRRLTAGGLSIEIGGRGEFLPKSAGMDVINKVFAQMAKGGFGGGGGGGKSTTGMVPEFASNLKRAIEAANKATGEHLQLVSGWRSQEHQNRLKAHDPSGMTARHSKHTEGVAGDLGYGGRLARQMTPGIRWLHEHAKEFDIHFPLTGTGGMPYEPWHAEQRGSRGGARPSGASASNVDNRRSNQQVVINIHNPQHPEHTAQATKRALQNLTDDNTRLAANRVGVAVA